MAETGLRQGWQVERGYCNPPYSRENTLHWIEKAHQETSGGARWVCDPPPSVDREAMACRCLRS